MECYNRLGNSCRTDQSPVQLNVLQSAVETAGLGWADQPHGVLNGWDTMQKRVPQF